MKRLAMAATALGMGAGMAVALNAQVAKKPPLAITPATASNPSITAFVRGVQDESRRRELELRRFDAQVTLRGALAEVTLDMSFAGTGAEALEGRLHIDLPDGAIVTGYALDVDGKMIEGSLVDAPKAKATYERQVRGQVDPGLGEIDKSGGFNTRVFPIDAKSGRHIRLRFVAPIGNGFKLPIDLAPSTGAWSVHIDGLHDGAEASVGSRRLDVNGTSASIQGSGALDGSLLLSPSRTSSLVSRHPLTGETFWQVRGDLSGPPRAQAGKLRIYWDRSRSQLGGDVHAALARVDQAINALRPDIIELVAFNSTGTVRTDVANSTELARAVGDLHYAGATSFSALAEERLLRGARRVSPPDTCLLISDGRATIDDGPPPSAPCRLFAIAAGEQADRSALAALAERSGGRLIEADGPQIDWRAPGVERVIDASGHPLDFALLPSQPGEYRLAVANPGSGPVRIVAGGREQAVPEPTSSVPFGGEGALIAARRLALLEGKGDRSAFLALSRRYSIASPTLSFLVLEQPADYIRADVAPAADYPYAAEYLARRAEADRKQADDRKERFGGLLRSWNEEVKWWQRDFDPNARPSPKHDKGNNIEVTAGRDESLPRQAPSAPIIVEPVAEESRSGEQDAVVTSTRRADRVEDQLNSLRSAEASKASLKSAESTIAISVDAWRPTRDYLEAFDRDPSAFDRLFGEWEGKAGAVPSFYLDSADWLMRNDRRDAAIETLLSAVELPTADSVTLGLVAARLERWGQYDLAIALRERQLLLESDRPQPKRLLALAIAARAKAGSPNARADYERAIALLAEVALAPLDQRWEGIDVIALREANALIPRLAALGGKTDLDPRLVKNLDSDLRVIIDWSSDAVDLDLWVDEPNGERAIYNHAHTTIGGRLSNDMTAGYGPEDYWLRRGPNGRFTVRTNRFASDRIDPNGLPRLHARLIHDFGRPQEREESIDLEMKSGDGNSVEIGTIQLKR